MPTQQILERNWNQNRELLIEAAHAAGIDPAIMVKIAGFESGFSTHARPISRSHPEKNTVRQFDGTMALSSAYGLGQFTSDTWLATLRRYGEKYGVEGASTFTKAQANSPAIRDNPRLQAAMLAEFTRENIARGRTLGGPDADANVYALHNLGAGDGPKFLAALRDNPNQRVDQVLSHKVIAGNASLYGDGSRTVAEAYRAMGSKMDQFNAYAAQVESRAPQQPQSQAPTAPRPQPAPVTHHKNAGELPSAAIYQEAFEHFLAHGNQYEYGRDDVRLTNREGNGRSDSSRNERDLDGDGLKGVDCSAFVWRGLKNAGYDVPNAPFTTHSLFNGHQITAYARQHFDVISAADARRDNGALKPGDIILFKDKDSGGQHVGIFKGYDANGHIRFIGSQVSTGPAEAGAAPGSYWNGRDFKIVGALRAKPEFQVRAPLHAQQGHGSQPAPAAPAPVAPQTSSKPHAAAPTRDVDHVLQLGEKGPDVARLQRRLFDLGYHAQNGKPLAVDGTFGADTLYALKEFQREHGLEGKGIAGPKTEAALRKAEASLMSDPSHPQHALFTQAVAKVAEAEKAMGIPVGPHTQRIAGAVVVEAVREGLTRIDRVVISDSRTLVWAIDDRKGPPEAGLGRTEGISLAQASVQPLAESSRQAHQVAVNVELQRADAQYQARASQAQPQPAMAR